VDGNLVFSMDQKEKQLMKVGLCIFLTHYAASPAEIARCAEELGFESLWVPEHPCIPRDYDTPFPGGGKAPRAYWSSYDPFVALSFAAAATQSIRLATGVCLLAQRDPIITAKAVASLDVLSGGRFLFGVGAGWLREEMELMGGNYPRRWSQVKERVLAMQKIWTEPAAAFHGEFVSFPPIFSDPKPLQKPHPPVHLGGSHANNFRRVAEWGDGWIPLRTAPKDVAAGRRKIEELAREAGRDGSAIEISPFGGRPERDQLKAYADAGASRYVIFVDSFGPGEMQVELAALASHLGL
jgi:probable F420-dependent oxidoreductase